MAVCMILGLLSAFRFPGSDFAWNAVNDVTDVDLLSDAAIYVSTHPQCENQAYNINNGDLFRWKEVSASTSSCPCIARTSNATKPHRRCTTLIKPVVKQQQMFRPSYDLDVVIQSIPLASEQLNIISLTLHS